MLIIEVLLEPVSADVAHRSGSGLTYSVEIRSVRERQFPCSCVDFRINGLGSRKHAEAVLLHLEGRHKKLFKAAGENGSYRIDIVMRAASVSTCRMRAS